VRLRKHASHFEKHVAELKDGAERVIRAYRKDVVERQQELERLADMAIELFATACVLARTQRLLEERGEDACAHELALCDLFVVEAGRRFRASRIALQSAQDELRRTVARDVRARRGYGVTDALLRDAAGGAAEESPITTEAAR
jgi:acyl-CoA dehydrogenase family protein 9